eukprot:777299_1
MANWFLVLNEDGIPLLSISGNPTSHNPTTLPEAPFSAKGVLSAIHSATSGACVGPDEFELKQIMTENAHMTFMARDDLIFVLSSTRIASCITNSTDVNCACTGRLNNIYDALVFSFGRQSLQSKGKILKNTLRKASTLVSPLLTETSEIDLITSIPEIIAPISTSPTELLDLFSEKCGVAHIALYSGHRIFAMTKSWSLIDQRDLLTIGI